MCRLVGHGNEAAAARRRSLCACHRTGELFDVTRAVSALAEEPWLRSPMCVRDLHCLGRQRRQRWRKFTGNERGQQLQVQTNFARGRRRKIVIKW